MGAIEIERAFAVPIYAAMLDEVLAHKDSLRAAILRRRERDPGATVTERGAWHSSGHLFEDDDFDLLRQVILAVARGATGREHVVSAAWAVVGGRGASHVPHSHAPSAWSGVVYIDVEASLGGRTDERAGCIEFLSPIANAASFFVPSGTVITPRDGLMLLFPGPLVHLVHPSQGDALRICVSFNLDAQTANTRTDGNTR
jgi:uncharacterized protein (TIGR02466 family)